MDYSHQKQRGKRLYRVTCRFQPLLSHRGAVCLGRVAQPLLMSAEKGLTMEMNSEGWWEGWM